MALSSEGRNEFENNKSNWLMTSRKYILMKALTNYNTVIFSYGFEYIKFVCGEGSEQTSYN